MQLFTYIKFKSNLQGIRIENKNLLIAISSGADSLCLLKLLFDYCEIKKYKVETVYIDHQWKNDSLHHTKHIINLMKAQKIPLSVYQIKNLVLSENKARQIRYKILLKHGNKHSSAIILTGHNKNDQVETFVYNIIRGTSLHGITGLTTLKRLNHKISILRPLINFSKAEISWFCRLFFLPIWSDITNYNFSIKRNRIRYELMPYLQNYFNPQIQNSLTKFINLCQQENEYIKENTLKLYILSRHRLIISLNLIKLNKQHQILKKRVLKLFFFYHFNLPIHLDIIEQLLSLHALNIQKTIFFHGLKIYIIYGRIYLYILKSNGG